MFGQRGGSAETGADFDIAAAIVETARILATIPEESQTGVTQQLQGRVSSLERRLFCCPRFDSDRTVVSLPDHEQVHRGAEVDPLWTIRAVSTYLAVPVGTLYQWRHRGEGPPAIRLGRHLRYDPGSVHRWALNRAS